MRAKLQEMRKEKGYTQDTFSKACGISRSFYSQIESGEKNPSLDVALRMKKILDYYDDDIFYNKMPQIVANSP